MNDAGKVAFTPRGTYSNSETYEYLDTVVYDGNAYAAKKITTGNAPSDPDNEYWALLARGGESVPAATKDRAGIVKLAYHEDVTEPGTYALDAVQANCMVQGTLAHQVLKDNVALINKLSRDNISLSSAVTDKGMYVLDAVEKNASAAGTLASQIAEQNTKLALLKTVSRRFCCAVGNTAYGVVNLPNGVSSFSISKIAVVGIGIDIKNKCTIIDYLVDGCIYIKTTIDEIGTILEIDVVLTYK